MDDDKQPASPRGDGGADQPAKAKAGPGRFGRRSLLRGGLLVGAGAVGGGVVGGFAGRALAGDGGQSGTQEVSVPFYGPHQAGILTNTQRQVVLASFDAVADDRRELAAVLRRWSELGAALTAGQSVTVPIYAPAENSDNFADATAASTTDDSLEAYQLGPNRLTLTIGFGRSLFVTDAGKDRFGLAPHLPDALINLPRFSGDQLESADSDGDVFLQACADDPQVAFHAVRSIARIAPDVLSLRWTQVGFTPDNSAGTPRNLMGFKDGTVNSNVHPPKDLDTTLWAAPDGPAWIRGGTYLVYRRIRMDLDHWDRLAPDLQDQVFGRRKLDGAPLGEKDEFSPLNLQARDHEGNPVVPMNAHVRLAAPETNHGAVILRRAFSYNNGTRPFVERWPPWRASLEYDAGLLFLAYQRDPRTAFVPIFTRLAEVDALNQFTTHNATALFAIPPGAAGPGDWVGRPLFS